MANAEILNTLFETIRARQGGDPEASYTASLLAKGAEKCAQKLGENGHQGEQEERGERRQHAANDVLLVFLVLCRHWVSRRASIVDNGRPVITPS